MSANTTQQPEGQGAPLNLSTAPTVPSANPLPQQPQPPVAGDAMPTTGGAPQPEATMTEGDKDAQEKEVSKAEFSLMRKFIRESLIETTHDVEVIRADPNSPLFATVKSFEDLDLDEALIRGLADMVISKPSKIQETALPILIKERKNMIAQSQSGTGKTVAFVLASLSRVDVTQKHPQVIILSPTYELAVQTYDVARKMAKFKPEITFRLVAKGEPISNHKWAETVLIGTPGRMVDSTLKYRNVDMSKIKVYVLDEADVMIDTQGHKAQSMRMRRALPRDCQILFFSATYDDEIRRFASDIVPNAVEIHLKREEQSLANIKQVYVVARTEEEKCRAIADSIATLTIGLAFVFCQTKKSANFLAHKLHDGGAGQDVCLISGDLTVEQRNAALLGFKEGRQRVMISTNLMARGIDIAGVTVVINYDLPIVNGHIDKETYLHRIGRTGRFGKSGLAINLISTANERKMITELEQHFGITIEEINTSDMEAMEKLDEVCS